MATVTVNNTTITKDQEKALAAKLIARATLKMVAASFCDKNKLQKGAGKTQYFVRYSRMNVPVESLSEGTSPSGSTFSLEEFTVTMDQWGDFVVLSDVSELTAKHPLVQEALELLADNAQRVIDREIQKVWHANSNIQYGDGSVTSRATLTTSLKMNSATIERARVAMKLAGANERGGPSDMDFKLGDASGGKLGNGHYAAVCGPEVQADIMAESSSYGSWVGVETYANAKALYAGEVGIWRGVRWVVTNFIPAFRLLGNNTTAVASAASGGITGFTVTVSNGAGTLSNSTTYYWKVTRKSLTRGFEEYISIEHTTATGAADDTFTFAMPSTAGYVYNVYFGSATGDANLKLAGENLEASESLTVLAVPASTTTAPESPILATESSRVIHPVYLLAAGACSWTSLQDLQVLRGGGVASDSDPLAQRRTLGYKFMAKALVADSTRMLRIEVYSAQS